MSFVDIAGIVKGASEGQGLGNKFLANIREAEAICQVIRVFTDDDVVHVDGRVSPKDDIETINTELILADLQTIEKVLPRLQKESRLVKGKADQVAAVEQAQQILDSGRTLYAAGVDLEPIRELFLLTAKPFLYVFNIDEEELGNAAFKDELRELVAPAEAIFLDAKVEAELVELDDAEALELLQSIGQEESGSGPAGAGRLRHARAADVPDRGAEGGPRLDDQHGCNRAGGGRCHPHRLPAGLHQGRGGLVRRPRRGRLDGRREGGRQGPHGGQGLRHVRRRRRGVPLQRLTLAGTLPIAQDFGP